MQDTPPISCRLEVLPGDGFLARVRNAAAFGYDAVSLPGRYLPDYIDELRTHAGDSPLPFAGLSLGFRGSLVSPHEAGRAECAASLSELFDLCAELRIGLLNMPPVLNQDNTQRLTDPDGEAQDRLLLGGLPAVCDEAAKRGVVLLLEPVNRFESDYMNTVGHAARLCRELGNDSLGVTIDFFHMQVEELNIAEAITEAGRWIKHVHVAENTRVEPGPGSMDFAPGFRALKDLGYDGFIELECRSLSGPAGDVLPKSAQYLRDVWRSC